MIKVYLNGHKNSHNIYELLRILMETSEIEFVDYDSIDNENLYIISSLEDNVIRTEIYKEGKLISDNIINDIDNINIRRDFEKKTSVGTKKSLYEAIKKVNNISSPWGILTGIRPSKIVHELREKGINKDEIFNILTEQYLIAKEKAQLLLEITEVESKYLYPLDKSNYNLYVSIPFCPTKCVYCSFPSYTLEKWEDLVDSYTETLLYEIRQIAELMKGQTINTVYIGGGTPTSIPKENLVKIISSINDLFGRENITEFTVEAGRPDTINEEILQALRDNHIDRISINPQTMNGETLKLIGRNHSPKDIEEAYIIAKDKGFKSINMDIIVGLPGEDLEDINNTMNHLSKLNPENLTVHTLAIKKTSKLNNEKEKYDIAEGEKIEKMLKLTEDYAARMGMKPYYMYRQKQILGNFENVGYAKEDKECIYNILIMEEKQTIIGVGAGAISKVYYPSQNRLERVPNVKSLKDYIDRIDEMIDRKSIGINNMLTAEA
ncbi:coproporphyrinogen dehydrogenase HemZ [Clostridium sp. D2Q-11]|uniref:Coproporphyrinogen dehydrogenase HemZ n=1 Tax=Anaeromonas frigoriresistens TaxID=2683708 RepID=A0A942Z9Z4_9FIRM|nr:coproporphyrinogen dehydrogenase HemZ [Anaeromonas frigoriresistens]MBS4539694.1 coproporphyrinogen dehydrogenase HemZ [Anaeromonas frigoriresistens]